MIAIITGTPGTGKSGAAGELSKILRIPVIDIKKIVRSKRIFTLDPDGEMEVDIKKLKKILASEIGKRKKSKNKKNRDGILENHLLCEFPLPADFVFVLRANPDILGKRLAKRRYGEKKLDGNLMSEMLDYCTQKAERNYKRNPKPLEIDTSRLTARQAALKMADAIRYKKKTVDKVDYTDYLKKYLGLRERG